LIHPTAIVYPGVIIEDDVHIGPYCVIGERPEHREFYGDKKDCGVLIKKGARIYSHVTIGAGTISPTIIGEGSVVFNHSHVGHDSHLDSRVTIGGNVSLAGHTTVMEGATVSGKSCTVQYCVIGAYGFVGGFTFATKHVGPGEKWLGFPAKYVGPNEIGLTRNNMSYERCVILYALEYNKLTRDHPL
jgi:UDP-N-acetylglucosamine acyltransferase